MCIQLAPSMQTNGVVTVTSSLIATRCISGCSDSTLPLNLFFWSSIIIEPHQKQGGEEQTRQYIPRLHHSIKTLRENHRKRYKHERYLTIQLGLSRLVAKFS